MTPRRVPEARRPGLARAAYLAAGVLPFVVSGWLLALLGLPVVVPLSWALLLRTVTGFVVTGLYHRGASHRSVTFHPLAERVLRVYGWLALGIGLRTWATVHRLHHAHADDDAAPFSPARPGRGLHTIARDTIRAHLAAARDPKALSRFAEGLPDDGLERFIASEERRLFGVFGLRMPLWALVLSLPFVTSGPMGLLGGLALFPAASGSVLWTSIWVVNGLGHRVGWRNFDTRDASTNVVRHDWLALGEALHNNHHARPGSACFAAREGEIDPGWWALRGLRWLGVVT